MRSVHAPFPLELLKGDEDFGIARQNCEVLRHQFSIPFAQVGTPDEVLYFQDDTENHYKTLVDVTITREVIQALGFELSVVVVPRGGGPSNRFVIPFLPFPIDGIFGRLVLQVEDAAAIGIVFPGSPGALVEGTKYYIRLLYMLPIDRGTVPSAYPRLICFNQTFD